MESIQNLLKPPEDIQSPWVQDIHHWDSVPSMCLSHENHAGSPCRFHHGNFEVNCLEFKAFGICRMDRNDMNMYVLDNFLFGWSECLQVLFWLLRKTSQNCMHKWDRHSARMDLYGYQMAKKFDFVALSARAVQSPSWAQMLARCRVMEWYLDPQVEAVIGLPSSKCQSANKLVLQKDLNLRGNLYHLGTWSNVQSCARWWQWHQRMRCHLPKNDHEKHYDKWSFHDGFMVNGGWFYFLDPLPMALKAGAADRACS